MNNDSPEKKFQVHISDEDYLKPSELDSLLPPLQPKKEKFVVHIEDDNIPVTESELPRNNGGIYFSNRKPVKQTLPEPIKDVTKQAPEAGKGSSAKKKKKKASRLTGVVCFCLVIAFTTVLSVIGISCVNDILAISRSDDLVTVNIPSDATTDEIIDILSENGLVKQKLFCKLFYNAFETVKNINKTKKPSPPNYLSGVYYLQKDQGLEGYLTEFKESQSANETVTLTFQEGWTVYQMFDRLEKFGVCSKERLLASLTGTEFEHEFLSSIPNNPNRTSKIEGYLFPETYEFFEESDPNSVIRKFLAEYEERWTEEYQQRADELGLTQDQIMIIASIIQREAASVDQMSLISSVIHNRLRHPVSWPTLGCDSTEDYIKNYVSENVSDSEAITYQQYYDTYSTQGLPPGPICNPGDSAIKAALYPDETGYYYFRHDKYGEIYMAKTQSEHDANGNKVLRANSK